MRTIIAAALLALASAGPASAGTATYSDPAGDAGAAPDITSVVVSDDAAGVLTFEISMPNRPVFNGTRSILTLNIDADANPATGGDGLEYFVLMDGASGRALFLRWNGSDFEPFTPEARSIGIESGKAIVRFHRSVLGDGPGFAFWLAAFDGLEDGSARDLAPDGDAAYTYEFAPKIQSVVYPAAALRARAGARFTVSGVRVALENGQLRPAQSVRCTATLAGKPLKRLGPCSFQVPKSARGKRIVVTVTATYGDATATLRQPVTVR